MEIETFDLLEFENANSHEKQIYAKKIDEHLQKIGFLILCRKHHDFFFELHKSKEESSLF